MERGLTIGQVAKQAGVNIETLRYYERLHLLSPAMRKPSGYRVYGPTELHRLQFIKNAQALGFSLHEIQEFLTLRVTSSAACRDVKKKTETKLAQVGNKIRDLQRLARELRKLIRACEAGQLTDECPVLKSFERGGRV